MKGIFYICCIVAFVVTGCSPRAIKNPREVAGEYVFRYKTGEMEVLILREDLSYRQELYSDMGNYRSHANAIRILIRCWRGFSTTNPSQLEGKLIYSD